MYGVAKEDLIDGQSYYGASKFSDIGRWNKLEGVFECISRDSDDCARIQYYNPAMPEEDSFRPVAVVGNVYSSYRQMLKTIDQCIGATPAIDIVTVQVATSLAYKTIHKYGIAPYYTIGKNSLTAEWYVVSNWRILVNIANGAIVEAIVVNDGLGSPYKDVSQADVLKLIGGMLSGKVDL